MVKRKTLLAFDKVERVLKTFEPLKGKKILDAGCGKGRIAIPLAEKGAKVCGIDFSEEMLKQARRKARKKGVEVSKRVNCKIFLGQRAFSMELPAT